jgi:cytochrome b561
MQRDAARYSSPAIVLHWAMAAVVTGMLASGLLAEYGALAQADKFRLIQLHKSFGVVLLLLIVLRVGVRLWRRPPALPAHLPAWEKKAAHLGHGALYAAMILMPLSGWAMVSASPYGLPTYVFNWFEWPHIPGLAGQESLRGLARGAHTVIGFTLIALILGHVAAVVKHAVIDRENLLRRMWWGGR